jgi:hypothetical protein
MREEIEQLAKMGPLPSYRTAMREDQRKLLEEYALLIVSVQQPVTDEEARALASLFGPDDCFGMEWTLVGLVESAPGWPLWDCLKNTNNEWIQMLRQRLENAGISCPRNAG